MLKQMPHILAAIAITLLLACCNRSETGRNQEFIVFERDTRDKDMGFKPTTQQIDQAETKLVEYLETKTRNNQTIYVRSLDENMPLQDRLVYYKRRYFGRISVNGERIIKIEFVFVRCGGQGEWEKIAYTNDETKGCWWSVLYNLDRDQIDDLNHRLIQITPQ